MPIIYKRALEKQKNNWLANSASTLMYLCGPDRDKVMGMQTTLLFCKHVVSQIPVAETNWHNEHLHLFVQNLRND